MSYRQFPAVNKIKVLDSAIQEKIGSFQVASATDLRYIVLHIYIKGLLSGSERVRLKLFGSNRYETPTAVSDWAYLSAIDDLNGGNWIGYLRFDFTGQPLNPNYYYFMQLETQNYTRNADVHYIAVNLDYGASLSNRVSGNDLAVLMAVLGEV